MENTIIILAEIVYACVITLKSGRAKVKLHLKDEVKQVSYGEEIMSDDIFLFPNQLFDAFMENVPMNINKMTLVDLTTALRGAKVMLESTLTDDGEHTNFNISKLMLQDKGIDDLEEASIMAALDAKAREKRAERIAAKNKAATKEAMAAMAAEFAALEEPTVETAPMQVLAETVNAEILAEAEAKVAAAEAAYAADPTPGKKGVVTKAKKALAALQA